VLVGCLYAPNGNPAPGPKFDYKLAWHARFAAHAAELLAADLPVVLAGDYNVAPEPRDVYPTTSYDGNALVRAESRAAYAALLEEGWTDAVRAVHPEATVYTFWDYRRNRWERNGGMRLDHLLLSPVLAPRLESAGVDRGVRGEANASDHAPAWIEIGAGRRRR
jgi:exodeoxyribonuclease-3